MTALLFVVLIFGSLSGARWFSPAWLEWMAAKLLARAAAIRMSRRVYDEQFAHYERQLVQQAVEVSVR